MEFIPMTIQDSDTPGVEAEKEVMNRLKAAFGPDDTGVIYHKFPITDHAGDRFDREPDFVILSRELGLIVVEVKGYLINHIQKIEGQIWYLQGIDQERSQPYSQAREQAFFLQAYFLKEQLLRDNRGNSKIPVNYLVALPNITQKEWEQSGFGDSPSTRCLTSNDLTPQSLRTNLADLPTSSISQSEYENARAAITGGEVISSKRGKAPNNVPNKGSLLEKVERGLNRLDRRQEKIGIQIPPGPQQIRGIAGSGKTVLLAMKAAAIHATNPDWKIALTFNTRSLYNIIQDSVEKFSFHLTDDEPDWKRLDILHAWGGSGEHGMYYKIAQSAGIQPNDVAAAQRKFDRGSPEELLASSCNELLQSANIQEEYDVILVDEAQDIEPPFFKMCFEALHPPKRLIWAYDEAQNLASLTAPTPKEVFGTTDDGELVVDLRGRYQGGILKSQIMRRSYRTPRSVLMTAHIFGMGLKSSNGAVQAIRRQERWEDIGYEVLKGDFREIGEPVQVTRPERYSPHPLEDSTTAKPFVRLQRFDKKDDEIDAVSSSIKSDIDTKNIDPEKVMVICLGSPNQAQRYGSKILEGLDDRSLTGNLVWEGNPSVFSKEDAVTISRIHRAKGNEAAIVYIVGFEEIEESTWYPNRIQARNAAFVAMTRTRSWCTVTGTGTDVGIFDELERILHETTAMNPVVEFPAPSETELEPYTDDTIATVDQSTDEIDHQPLQI